MERWQDSVIQAGGKTIDEVVDSVTWAVSHGMSTVANFD